LDIYGSPEKFGKQVGGDIISNKKTYLLLKSLELADAEQTAQLHKWIEPRVFDNQEKVEAVTAIYNAVGVKQHAEETMHAYADIAFEALEKINLPEEKKQYLRDFADSLMVREY
ncbi:MAG TPA: polyprenyl synthetase family protein, partial [Mucilaginibacter sp.]|nr:polyprenyl synthetase family protein [Mucilaginibacter sp.]